MPLTALLTMSLLTVQTVREEDEVLTRDCLGKEKKKNSSFLPLPPWDIWQQKNKQKLAWSLFLCKAVIARYKGKTAQTSTNKSDSAHASPVILQTYASSSTVSTMSREQ